MKQVTTTKRRHKSAPRRAGARSESRRKTEGERRAHRARVVAALDTLQGAAVQLHLLGGSGFEEFVNVVLEGHELVCRGGTEPEALSLADEVVLRRMALDLGRINLERDEALARKGKLSHG